MSNDKFFISNLDIQQQVDCDVPRPPLEVRHLSRLDYIFSVLGEDEVLDTYHHNTLKLAVDGIYSTTRRDSIELVHLAKKLAEREATLSKLGRGTTFSKLVASFRDKIQQ